LAGDTAFFRSHLSGVDLHREPAASEPAVVYREAAASEMAHRKPVTSEAAAHGVTSEAAAHGVTSAAKATAAMSAPAASMSAPATKRHSAGGHSHAEGDSSCGRNQFPSHRSLSLFASDLPSIEDV
jgi:hypothetical protein